MMAGNECPECSERMSPRFRFCPYCGSSLANEVAEQAAGAAPVRAASQPSKLFDPFQPVGPDNEIPADCVWVTHPYPGPPDKRAARGSVPARLAALGTLYGRPLSEITGLIGLPNSVSSHPGGTLRQWTKVTAYGGSYHYALRFDRYELCTGITHQSVH
jgi:hypothetical protein